MCRAGAKQGDYSKMLWSTFLYAVLAASPCPGGGVSSRTLPPGHARPGPWEAWYQGLDVGLVALLQVRLFLACLLPLLFSFPLFCGGGGVRSVSVGMCDLQPLRPVPINGGWGGLL